MNDILDDWKKNVQFSKWKYLKSNISEFQNTSIDRVIKTFRSFFHKADFDKSLVERKNHISGIDPSQYWLHFILSQTNPDSIYLVHELRKVIEYYQKRDLDYLKHKLLKKNGRIDQKSFRDKYFEVFLNYNLEKSGIKIDFKKCYRNELNKKDEGFDSYFQFKNKTYAVECLKIKSWQENMHSAAFKIIQVLAKTLKKNPNKVSSLPVSIFAKLSGDFKNIDSDFRKILKDNFINSTDEINEKSRVFEDLKIYQNSNIAKIIESNPNFLKDYIGVNARFKSIKILDKTKKDIGLDFEKADSERHEYEIVSNYKTRKSPIDFEDHLMNKINKKISQLKKSNIKKKILAVEFESYPGFGSFPVSFNYKFQQVFDRVNWDLTIILFFKDSKTDQVYLNKKSYFNQNDEFMRYFLYGEL